MRSTPRRLPRPRFFVMEFQRLMISCLAVAVMLFPDPALGLEYWSGWSFFDAFFKETNYLTNQPGGDPDFVISDDTYAILGAYPYAGLDFNAHFSAYFQAGFEWTHSWDVEDSEDWDADVIGAAMRYTSRAFSADAGIQPFHPGNGLISYGDEPGVSLAFNGWDHAYIKGDVFQILETSPMSMLSLGYHPGFLETVEIFGAGFHDADDGMSNLFASFYDGADVKTIGNLFWAGAMADFFVKKAYVSGMWVQQFGAVDINSPSGSSEMDVSAFLMDAQISYPVLETVSASAFLFVASGDSRPLDGRLNAFISPMPFNDRTAIFFNGGFARYDVEKKVSLGGVTWDGVITPGLGFDYQPYPDIVIKFSTTLLFPEKDTASRNNFYGWETDTRVTYEFYSRQHLFFAAGVLTHGDYWIERIGYRPDPATRLAAGLDLSF